MSSQPIPNIIVFGETGAGKSSLVNMLGDDDKAPVSIGTVGATFYSRRHEKTIHGSRLAIFDTAGLSEAPKGAVSPPLAIDNLFRLIRSVEGGLHLFVHVMRGSGTKDIAKKNYELFYEGFRGRKVPIVMVVTGLEVREDMDGWWDENIEQFDNHDMCFNAVACITATAREFRDGEHNYDEHSKRKVKDLIRHHHSKTPWSMPFKEWVSSVAFKLWEVHTPTLGFEQGALAQELERVFPREATIVSLTRKHGTQGPPPNVIVFGETGVGKSSVVNMFDGDETDLVGNRAQGVTFAHKSYQKLICQTSFKVFDTVGLNEGVAGAMDAAIEELYKLIMGLENGISLLVYVMRAPRITATGKKNYELFQTLCDGIVPTIMVVTGLEDMLDMDQWWRDNQSAFDKCNMLFCEVACVTATKGRYRNGAHIFEDEFASSKITLEEVIGRNYSRKPWRMAGHRRGAVGWRTKVAGIFRSSPTDKLCQLLQEFGGLTRQKAWAKARQALQ